MLTSGIGCVGSFGGWGNPTGSNLLHPSTQTLCIPRPIGTYTFDDY